MSKLKNSPCRVLNRYIHAPALFQGIDLCNALPCQWFDQLMFLWGHICTDSNDLRQGQEKPFCISEEHVFSIVHYSMAYERKNMIVWTLEDFFHLHNFCPWLKAQSIGNLCKFYYCFRVCELYALYFLVSTHSLIHPAPIKQYTAITACLGWYPGWRQSVVNLKLLIFRS